MKGKKEFLAVLLAGVMAFAVPQTSFAYEIPKTVSVGLESVCKNVSSANIGGTSLLVGNVQNGTFYEAGQLAASKGFTVKAVQGNYVMIQEKMTLEDAQNLVASLKKAGVEAFLGYTGEESWTVYTANAALSVVEQKSGKKAVQKSGFTGIRIDGAKEGNLLIADNSFYALGGCEKDDTFTVNGKRYRGYLKFAKKGNTMTAVNVVNLEEYLYGVLPAEMPPSYDEEALKAQALAARTYAITKLGAHEGSGYQLCDTTSCQVYKGYDGEQPSTNDAVQNTTGQIICYNGVPIEAVFSASAGGYTENSEDVWNGVTPYLRAVPEIGEPMDSGWTRTFTVEDMNRIVAAKSPAIGSISDIKITKLATGGRIQELEIVGTKGSIKLTKENIRTYFSPVGGTLPSKMFTINGNGGMSASASTEQVQKVEPAPVNTATGLTRAVAQKGITAKTEGTLASMNGIQYAVEGKQEQNKTTPVTQKDYAISNVNISTKGGKGVFVLQGRGNGHGVGLSQKGAQGMAKKGYNYQDIVKHYYTGVTIEG